MEPPEPHEQTQLDRIEDTVRKLWARVDTLERRASFWGALGGALTMLVSNITSCT